MTNANVVHFYSSFQSSGTSGVQAIFSTRIQSFIYTIVKLKTEQRVIKSKAGCPPEFNYMI